MKKVWSFEPGPLWPAFILFIAALTIVALKCVFLAWHWCCG